MLHDYQFAVSVGELAMPYITISHCKNRHEAKRKLKKILTKDAYESLYYAGKVEYND